MKMKISAAAAFFCVVAGAQTPTTPTPTTPQSSSSSNESTPLPSLRRFSAGVTLSVNALRPIKAGSRNIVTTGPAVDSLYATAADSPRVGYGVNAQIGITEHFTFNAALIVRRIAYLMNSDIFEGTDIASTSVDERKHTVRNEDTRARFYELPITVRYYGEVNAKKRLRWFGEGGLAFRRVSNIKTSVSTTIGVGETQCCTTTPAPSRKTVRGVVVGLGLHGVDPLGIRVIPQIRYTRWMGTSFNNFSTITERNQIEGVITLSF